MKCLCGCGQEVSNPDKYGRLKKGYIYGHNFKYKTKEHILKWIKIRMEKGFKHSEESKKKISEKLKGKVPWMKGKTHTLETRIKISNAGKGRIPWNKGLKGVVHISEESIKKRALKMLGNSWNKGKIPWMKGKKHTLESKKKMSLSRLGRPTWNKGKKLSFEYKEKARLAAIKRLKSGLYGASNTAIELKVKNQLQKIGVNFIHQWALGNFFCCDFYLPDFKIIVECDGDYWHSLPSVIEKDKRKNFLAENEGLKMVRISESEIKKITFDIKKYLPIFAKELGEKNA